MPLDVNRLYLNHLTRDGRAPARRRRARAISLKMAAEGTLQGADRPRLPLSQAVAAHELVESRGGIGKVILDPTQL